jgi:DNA-binding XRE family transcriptional regulator
MLKHLTVEASKYRITGMSRERYDAMLMAAAKLRKAVMDMYSGGKRMSQAEIAQKLGVSRQRINQIVNGPAHKARSQIHKDIAEKRRPLASAFKCVDCGAPATQYDHRDYSKRRDVEPVCEPCNKKRGRGKNGKTKMRADDAKRGPKPA